MNKAWINCKKKDWKAATKSKLQGGIEVDFLAFEHTPEAIAFCESLAESHGMLFGACLETGSATF